MDQFYAALWTYFAPPLTSVTENCRGHFQGSAGGRRDRLSAETSVFPAIRLARTGRTARKSRIAFRRAPPGGSHSLATEKGHRRLLRAFDDFVSVPGSRQHPRRHTRSTRHGARTHRKGVPRRRGDHAQRSLVQPGTPPGLPTGQFPARMQRRPIALHSCQGRSPTCTPRPGPPLEHGPHSAPRAPSSLRYRTPRPSTSAIALRLSALRSGGRPASRCENGHKPAGTEGSASCGCGVAAQKRDMAILATPWLVWV